MRALAAALGVLCAASGGAPPQPASGAGVQTWLCGGAGAGEQAWSVEAVGADVLLQLGAGPSSRVLAVPQASNATGSQLGVELRAGGASPPPASQRWTAVPISGAGGGVQLVSALNRRCAAASDPIPGARLYLQPCNASNALQSWQLPAAAGGVLQQAGGVLGAVCGDVGGELNCSSPSLAAELYCNASAPPAARAADLASRLTVFDLRLLLGGWYISAGVPRLGLGRIAFGEALHGLGTGCGHAFSNASYSTTGCPTSFPHATLLGASFNRSLWRAVGDAISTEARATHGPLLLWTPNVNLARDQRWGRSQEVSGDEPLLTSEYAAAFVAGLQADAPGLPLRAVATCKHWAAYDFEGPFDNVTRHTFDAIVSRKDLAEYFLPPFQACVQRGGAAAAMSSINALNGVPGAANANLTLRLLHGQWGSAAFVTSDCGTVADLQRTHRYAATPAAAVADALAGGTDYNCGNFERAGVSGEGYFNAFLPDALAAGLASLAQVRAAAARFLTAVFRLGLADGAAGAGPYASWGPERVDSPAHRQLALEGARQGIVLLRNDGGALPLRLRALASLAVLGPHGNMSAAMLANYAGSNTLAAANTPLLRLRARADAAGVPVTYVAGVPTADSNATAGVAAAAAAAAAASAAVLFLGLDQVLEREGLDRSSLALPPAQQALLAAVGAAAAAARTPLVVVLVGGGAIAEAAPAARALVAAFYPGELGGEALAQLLLGEAPFAGRLPVTVYAAGFAARRAPTDMALAPHGDVPGITSWYAAPSDVLFPFGAGLASAPFALAAEAAALNVSVDAHAWLAGAVPSWALTATNLAPAGAVPADIVALAFFEPGAAGEPAAKLADFARAAAVPPGSRAALSLALPASVAARVDANGTRTLLPGLYRVRLGGDAAGGAGNTGAPIEAWLTVTGTPAVIDSLPW